MSENPTAQPVQGTVVGITPPQPTPAPAPQPTPTAPSGGNEVDTFIANQKLYFFRYAPKEVVSKISSKDKETLFEMTKIYVMLVNSPTEIIPMLSIAPVEGWRNSVTGQIYYNYVNCGPDGYKNYMPKYDFASQNVQMDGRYTLIGSRAEVPEDGWKKLTNGILFKLGKLGNAALKTPGMAMGAVGTGLAMGARAAAPVVKGTASLLGNALTLGMLRRGGGGRTRKHTKKNKKTRKHKK